MSKTRNKVRGKTGEAKAQLRPKAAGLAPDWVLVVLAGLGALLTAYLLLSKGSSPAFCAEGSSCDIVQASRWSVLFGLPLTLWGLAFYLCTAFAAAAGRQPVQRWRRVFALAVAGVLVSLYLNAISLFVLQAFCLWCLISLALVVAIFVRALMLRPANAPAGGWARWAKVHAIVMLPALALIAAAQAGWLSPPADPRLDALAEHLERSGAKYYGAFWCPQCQRQSDLFGRSADKLPYVECSPNGRNSALAVTCVSAGVHSLPTWVIRGQSHTGVLQPDELARLSRFMGWNAAEPQSAPAQP